MLLLVTSLAVVAVLAVVWWYRSDPLGHLPGVRGLPIFGVAHILDLSRVPQQVAELGRQYGEVFRLGNIVFVVTRRAAHQVMVERDPIFASRYQKETYLRNKFFFGAQDLSTRPYDAEFQLMRKVAFKAMHLHGAGLQRLEDIVQEETRDFLGELSARERQDVAPTKLVYACVTNILTTMLLGDKFSRDSEEVQLVYRLDESSGPIFNIVDTPEIQKYPWLLNLPLNRYRKKRQQLQTALALRDRFLQRFVTHYKGSYEGTEVSCGLTSMLESQEVHGKDVITDTMINNIMLNLVMGGTITTSSTVSACIFILAHHPEIQDRMFESIRRDLGVERLPRWEDRDVLPYVQAVILELMRYQSTSPLGIPRIAQAEAEVCGHRIPQNTKVSINLWAVHHDPGSWEKPHEFYPQHFLTSDGSLKPVHEYKEMGFFPFGAGRRACVAETMAKSRLFLLVTSIVQRFKIVPPNSGKLPECSTSCFEFKTVHSPPFYEVQFVQRR